jgi:hypothetical protein
MTSTRISSASQSKWHDSNFLKASTFQSISIDFAEHCGHSLILRSQVKAKVKMYFLNNLPFCTQSATTTVFTIL